MVKRSEGIQLFYLGQASKFAQKYTGCTKVAVGSIIVTATGKRTIYGANRAIPNVCIGGECLRVLKYGNNDKTHRAADDCHAIHSEVDAIAKAAKNGVRLQGATIYVTRYPCEGCARAIVAAGITTVVYGRETPISTMTATIFGTENVQVIHCPEFIEQDATN